jgi:uncharacterized protein YjbI with pentapeptide repeats/TolB-like protein
VAYNNGKSLSEEQEAEVTIKQPCVVLEVDGNSYPGGLGAIPAGTPFYGILQLLPGHHNIRFSYNNTTITDQGTFQVGRMVRHEYKTQTAIGSPIILDVNVKAGKKYVATGISIGNSWSVLFGEVKRKESKEEKILESGVESWNKWRVENTRGNPNFQYAYFPKANLQGANLHEADLQAADLDSTDLRGANFNNADLTGANLAGADLRGASLASADIQKANLRRARLDSADIHGANLAEATLQGANLTHADLRQANLHGTNLENTNLMYADFRGARLEGGISEVVSLYGTKFDPEKLRKIKALYPDKLATIWDTTKQTWAIDNTLLEQINRPDWRGWPEEKEQAKDAENVKKTTIAVMPFNNLNVSEDEAKALAARFADEIQALATFTILEREQMREILREQGFQHAGACDEISCLTEMGKLLSVEKIIGGSISKVGKTYSVQVRIIDLQTGKVEKAVSRDYSGGIDGLMTVGMREVAEELCGKVAQQNNVEVLVAPEHKYEGDRKSPVLGGILSGVCPGLGQAYARQYIWGAAFFSSFVLGAALLAAPAQDSTTTAIGAVLFLMSWIGATVEAPFAVIKYNDKAKEKYRISLQLNPSFREPGVSFNLTF